MAGLTIKPIKRIKFGNAYGQISEITFDDSYPTGGEALLPSGLALNVIEFAEIESAGGYVFEYDHVNKKVIVRTPVGAVAAHTHVFTGAAMSVTPTVLGGEPAAKLLQNDAGVLKSTDITAIPLGTPGGTNAANGAIAAAAAAEVANATDLHLVTTRIFAVGW